MLDKELAVQREAFVRKLDNVEKRQSEITAQQANSLTAISNRTATVGNFTAVAGVLITLFVFGAGFVTYLSATTKAEQEARSASENWFEQNAIKLRAEIETLRVEATAQINTSVNQVVTSAGEASKTISAAQAAAVLNASKTLGAGEFRKAADAEAMQAVAEASQSLRSKPEADFTAADFFTRGLSYFSNQDFHAALAAFDSAIQLFAANTPLDLPAQYLFGKGATLSMLNKPHDAIAVYDEMDKRFWADTTPAVGELLTEALLYKGATFGQRDKHSEAIAVYDELDKRFQADTTLAICMWVAKGLIFKATSLAHLDRPQNEITVYDDLVKRYESDTTPAIRELVVKALVYKGGTLSRLPKLKDAINAYDELVERFGADTTPAVLEWVAKGLNGAGFKRIMLAKQQWEGDISRGQLLDLAIKSLYCAALHCKSDGRAMILGNMGYSLFLAGDLAAAAPPTLECLKLGGQEVLAAQRKDALLHRVEPEDSQYEALLDRLWQSLPSVLPKS